MDAGFGLEIAIRELAVHLEGRILDSAAVAGLQIGEIGLVAAPLGPAEVETEKHLGPILSLSAAGPRMDRDDRAEAIVFASEHQLEFLALELCARGLKCGCGFASRLRIVHPFFFGHREEELRLFERFLQKLVARELGADAVLLLEDRLGVLRAIPEIELARLLEQLVGARG